MCFALRQRLGTPVATEERAAQDPDRVAAIAALTEESFAREFTAGKAMTAEQAMDCALQDD